MGVQWTKEQQEVIRLRDRNILVSAAAGSGKTAVLVERILSKITDNTHPADIDRLLIMTFTRAAAGEMKERISAVIEKALGEDPDNEHLQRQTTLLHTAQITTIDGFCAYIIRNYFHLIGLDPGYRTADEGELKLLRGDVVKALLEEHYAQKDEKFQKFVECFATGKSDENLGDLIQKLYEMAMSNPFPEEWLQKCLGDYRIESLEELRETEWMKMLWDAVGDELQEAELLIREARNVCAEADGPYLYEDALNSDLILVRDLQELAEKRDYNGTVKVLVKPAFARLSTKKALDVEEQKKQRVKELRDEEKGILKELGQRYFQSSEEEILEMIRYVREPIEMLIELTIQFMEQFGMAKREKNILDFTDMEHFALQILMTKEGEEIHMSQAARELSAKYDEVLVDEYQDSNFVQELLTTAVSGWINQKKNIFMVGDVKQSIYRFRLARPELFMEKYKSYSTEEAKEQRIDLHKNFRSRAQVLESVNFIFRQIMGEDLGGVAYDKDAALYPGASFPEGESEEFVKTEVLLIEKDGEEMADVQESADAGAQGSQMELENQNAQELEALAIAQRIQEIVGKEQIVDKETREYRSVEYGDIVILLRTAYGWAETFREVLASQGIPVYCTSRTGYFSALEIVTVLNYLKVCDNPLQDIPLMGVLRSPIVGCTSQELAELRIHYPKGLLYESLTAYVGESSKTDFLTEKDFLKLKLSNFLQLLEKVRNMAAYTPVHELILYVLKETGYGNYARALPGGEQRFANLTMLVEKAMDYEKTSYRGLFNFVRYIEQLQAYEVDYGEVNLTGAGNTAVEIMTIHKSKGLEFPVVFVAGMGKQFNFQDMNAGLLLHPELGIGADAVIPEKRVIASSLNKQIIRRQLLKESLGEELRVLYVAMTRAKEKLILTGTVGKLEKQMVSLSRFLDEEEELLPLGTRIKAKNYWAFVLPALVRHRAMSELLGEYGILMKKQKGIYDDVSDFVIKKVTVRQMTEKAVILQAGNQMQEEYLKNWDADQVYDKEVREEIEKRFSFVYPYKYLEDIPVKVSVSDLKKRSWHDESELEENISVSAEEQVEEQEAPVPAFMAEKQEEYKGAARGTAYHRLMECLDYAEVESEEQLEVQLKRLLESQKMTEQEAECIRIRDIKKFVDSELGQRMKKAVVKKQLYREQPFVIRRSASLLDDSWKDETILVQGIIDAYFTEDGEIVLVDYKTDRVRKGQEQKLVDLYHVQLEDYAQALERMTGMKVKEKIIYSFTLQKAILL
ncbi:helicase-exonuclease AddAB subunit AddA [Blautia luti]|uniref:ATP-dependent helicase/nuclease subunit A n=1 Tax=Blautia luti DSM 14534 = JCM 17040 TaxID=649762 RepID=A0A844GNQ4_9FIRM|nr:helicase-exonuclease AddAB subunit AddA [Blautia luti]MTD62311.1 helicase-exonuclease AddAB subunit AddA [Blautia luti DSM 14534 = JCM 17040]BEI61559.1 helicase-exonuclease AddAB subunit AddA [Blautia luti]